LNITHPVRRSVLESEVTWQCVFDAGKPKPHYIGEILFIPAMLALLPQCALSYD
jgi:hypothetical protein